MCILFINFFLKGTERMADVDIDDELQLTTKTTVKKMKRLKTNKKVRISMTSRASWMIESTTTATSAAVGVASATKMMKSHEVTTTKVTAMKRRSTTRTCRPG